MASRQEGAPQGAGRKPVAPRGPDNPAVPNGTPSPPPEPGAPGGGMSWAARVASAKPPPAAANGSAPDGPPPASTAPPPPALPAAPVSAPAAPQPTNAGVKLPPGVEGRQPSIKFGDIDPTEMVKEQPAAPPPAAPKTTPPTAAAAAPVAPAPAAAPPPQPAAAPLPVVPAAGSTAAQRPGGYAAAAAGGGPKPAAAAAVPVMMPPQGIPQQMQQQARQHGGGPRGGQGRGPSGQQPNVGLNPAMGMYPQQFGMPAAFSMNPSAATFGPGMGGMMYMPGGSGYFAPNYPQAWQGAQYSQYGMNPAAVQAGSAGQQGMPTSSGMPAPPQQQPAAAPYAAAAAGAPKPAPVATPPREKKILRLENPDTHEVIDLSKPLGGGGPAKPADARAAAPAAKPAPAAAAAETKAPEAAAEAKTGADALKGAGPSKAAAEAAAAAALKPKEAAAVATPPPAAPASPAVAAPAAAAPAAPAAGTAAAAAATPKQAAVWGSGPSFKEKLMIDPAEKKRQEEEAARKKAAAEEAARKAAAEEEAARKAAAEEEAAHKAAAEEEAARKAAAEEEAARQAAAEEAAALKAEQAKRQAEEDRKAAEAAKKKAAEEAAQKAAEEAKRQADEAEVAEKKAAAQEAAAKQKADEEAALAATAAKAAAAEEAAASQKASEKAAATKGEEQAAAAAAGAAAASAAAASSAAAAARGKADVAAEQQQDVAEADGESAGRTADISPFSSTAMEEGEIPGEPEPVEDDEPPTGFEDDESGRKRYNRDFLFFYGNRCTDVPKGIETETFKQLSRENMPPGPPMGGRGPRGGGGGGGNFGDDDRWQSGRLPSGPMPGPPGMRGDPRLMGRQQSGRHRGGAEADQWERGKPLPPMPGMQQYDGRRGGPPPGMRMPGGAMAQLHKTESAYKVGATRTDDPAEEQAQKRLKSLLNKITKDNFAKITGQIVDVINERKLAITLSGFINQIFDKALTETHFAELYADLVAALNPALPQLKDEEGNDVQFRRTLLNKCQEEFEAGVTAMKAVSEREKHAKETGETPPQEGQEDEKEEDDEDEEEKEEKPEEVEAAPATEAEIKDEAKAKHDAEMAAKKAELAARKEERKKAMAELQARKRMLGNIVFVGQLFKKGVLTETVMHTCIKQLLEEVGNPKPEDVECMCKLLATVGGLLDSSTKTVKNFNNSGKAASTKEVMNVYFGRIETLARNEAALDSRHRFMLMDLIEQRRNRWRPRKEAEGPKTIEEIHREEALKRNRSAMLDRQQSGRGDSFRGARGGPPPGRPPFDNRVDAPIRAMNRVGSNDFLGPGGQQSFRPGGRPGPQRGGDRSSGGPPSERQPSGRQQGPPAPPARSDRAPEPAPAAEPTPEPEPSAATGLSAEKMQTLSKRLLVELYNAKDVKEGLTCVKELVEQGAEVPPMFEFMLTTSLESKGTDWDMLAALLRSAAEESVFQRADLERGARLLLDNLDDLLVDVPKAPTQVGAILGTLVAAGGADLAVLAVHIRTADANPDEIQEGEDTMLVSGGGAAKTLGSLLQKLTELKGEEAARDAWKASGEQLAAFLPQSDREDEAKVQSLAKAFGLASIAF